MPRSSANAMVEECVNCEDPASAVCKGCDRSFCKRCSSECAHCSATICMSCSAICDFCIRSSMCQACTIIRETCKCCKETVAVGEHAVSCSQCVLDDWLAPPTDKTTGFLCTNCENHCMSTDACNVKTMQDACPICFDEFDGNLQYELQQCELHKVCIICAERHTRKMGCPLCREGCTMA
mmetsp:Transcript_23835/g.39403  ORF Transcript_23835/g.39403 Transcript_23835/m.39403 type:complete len:180 (+) Transcript_23835:65-604(+)